MAEIEINEQNFESEVKGSSMPVLVDFWAPWCGPCKMIAPIVEEIAREFEGRIKVGKTNTDENLSLASQYQITSIPTVMIFKDGKPVEKVVGYKSRNDLRKLVENHI